MNEENRNSTMVFLRALSRLNAISADLAAVFEDVDRCDDPKPLFDLADVASVITDALALLESVLTKNGLRERTFRFPNSPGEQQLLLREMLCFPDLPDDEIERMLS